MTGARVHQIRFSHVDLDPRWGVLRAASTPEDLRGPDFDARFDAATLFYDLYRSEDGERVIALGPPFRGGIALADLQFRAEPGGAPLTFVQRPLLSNPSPRAPARLEIAAPPGVAALFARLGSQEWRIPIQPNLAAAFAGRTALVTTSCDNHLDWIEDWARFHAVTCGVDAVVLYDNASQDYGVEEVEARLAAIPGLRDVAVIDQPARFGIRREDVDAQLSALDDMFLQTAMLRHAIDRILPRAAAMLNLDIDELLLLEDGVTVGSLLDRPEPAVSFARGDVVAPPSRDWTDLPRHSDARLLLQPFPRPGHQPKWVVRPGAFPANGEAGVHRTTGVRNYVCPPETAWVAHVQEVTRKARTPERIAALEGPSEPSDLLARRLTDAFKDR